ncbi:MAG: hypothetical protein ACRCWD_01410 [Culicoidibacterales bacterium]
MIHYQTLEIAQIQAHDIIEVRGIEFQGGYDPQQLIIEAVRPDGYCQIAKLEYNSSDYYRTGMPFTAAEQQVILDLFAQCQKLEIGIYVGEHGYDVFQELAMTQQFSQLATLKQLASLRKQAHGAVRPLLTWANQTINCEAKVMRFGEKRGSYDEGKTILLTDVRLQTTGELITDHLWTTYTAVFQAQQPYESGQRIQFQAKVTPYHKGNYGTHVRDFRLTLFQNMTKIEEN